MATIQTLGAIDTLVRANQANWGLADDLLNQWLHVNGGGIPSLTSYTVAAPNQNKGVLAPVNFVEQMQLGTSTSQPINLLVRQSTITGVQAGVFWRYLDANNYYYAFIVNGVLNLQKVVAGTITNIGTAALTGWTSGSIWWIRVTMTSTTAITANAWQDGVVEPGSPLISVTDASLASAGTFGIIIIGASTVTDTHSDFFMATDNGSTILGYDTFARTVLNTASDTFNKWHHWRGDPSGLAINGNAIQITATGGDFYDLICGFNCWTNGTVKMRGMLNAATDAWGVRARWQSDSYYYMLFYTNQTIFLALVNNGVLTTLAAGVTFSYTAGTKMWLELDCIGSTLNGYAWLDGNPKPSNPTCTATDTTYLNGGVWSPYGNFGLYYNPATNGRVGTFDQFSSTSLDAAYSSVDTPYGQGLYGANDTLRVNNFAGLNLSGGTDDLSLIKAVGVTGIYYRYVLNWGYMEPVQGLVNWDMLDDVIARGMASGINCYAGLEGVPTWAQYTPTDFTANPLFNAAYAATFAASVAQRYDGSHGHGVMLAIECANEEYASQATGGTYAALLAAAIYPAVKAVNSSILVGSPANTAGTPYYGFLSAWMDNWYASNGNQYVDFFSMHPYPDQFNTPFNTIGSTGQSLPMLLQQQDAIMTANQDSMPVWITEQGWPPANFNSFPSNYLPMPETNIQLLAMLDYLRTHSRRYTHYFWYSLGDWYNGVGANLQTPYYSWQAYIQSYPAWAWIAGSVYYGAFNLNNPSAGYYVTSRQLGNMQIQEALTPLARYEGDKKSGQYIGSRKMRLTVKVVGASRTDLEVKLDALYLALKKPQQRLNIHTGDGRYFIADAIFAPADLGIGQVIAATIPVDFVCQQPYSNAFLDSAYGISPQVLSPNPSAPNYILNFTVNVLNATQFSRPVIVITNKRTALYTALSSTNQFVTVGMTNGVVYTTIYVAPLPEAVYAGDTLTLQSGVNTQTIVVASNAAIGATSITFQSFTANFSYPVGSTMLLDIHWTTVALQQWLDNQYWDVLAGNYCGVNGDALVFCADPVQGISVIDTASPSTQCEFLGTPVTVNPGRNDLSLLISSPSVPIASVAVFYTQRYQN